eukprot:896944-Amphidinium_carterae.1
MSSVTHTHHHQRANKRSVAKTLMDGHAYSKLLCIGDISSGHNRSCLNDLNFCGDGQKQTSLPKRNSATVGIKQVDLNDGNCVAQTPAI